MQTIGQCLKSHRPIGRFSSTSGKANSYVSGLLMFYIFVK